jgi:hypothetical protein
VNHYFGGVECALAIKNFYFDSFSQDGDVLTSQFAVQLFMETGCSVGAAIIDLINQDGQQVVSYNLTASEVTQALGFH